MKQAIRFFQEGTTGGITEHRKYNIDMRFFIRQDAVLGIEKVIELSGEQ